MTVHIAIIDSGINPWHSHVKGVEGGVAFYQDPAGKVLDFALRPSGFGNRVHVPRGKLAGVGEALAKKVRLHGHVAREDVVDEGFRSPQKCVPDVRHAKGHGLPLEKGADRVDHAGNFLLRHLPPLP